MIGSLRSEYLCKSVSVSHSPSLSSPVATWPQSEELIMHILACLSEMCHSVEPGVREKVWGQPYRGKLGHTIYLCLNLSKTETNKALRYSIHSPVYLFYFSPPVYSLLFSFRLVEVCCEVVCGSRKSVLGVGRCDKGEGRVRSVVKGVVRVLVGIGRVCKGVEGMWEG